MTLSEKPYQIKCDGLRLEAALHEGDGGFSAVVLHPHPLFGGDMHNHVVVALCEAFADLRATTLRVNFRGTGDSEGSHDNGRGEANDARAACSELRRLRADARLLLAGYSFGGLVAAIAAEDARPDGLVLVAPPFKLAGETPRLDASVPVLVMTGAADRIAPPESIELLRGPGRTVTIVPGVDHGWWPGTDALGAAVRAFVESAFPSNVGR
jgi:alpha/beta superfamily hydrolase